MLLGGVELNKGEGMSSRALKPQVQSKISHLCCIDVARVPQHQRPNGPRGPAVPLQLPHFGHAVSGAGEKRVVVGAPGEAIHIATCAFVELEIKQMS